MNRERFEAALGEPLAAEPLLELFGGLPDTFFYAKDRESRFVYANHRTWEALGASSEEAVLGKTDESFHPPLMAMAYIEEDRRVMASGAIMNRVWLVHNHRLKLPEWVVSSKVPLCTVSGEVVGIAGVMYRIETSEQRGRFLQELDPVIRYVDEHYDEPVSMPHLASLVPCSQTQLNRRFQALLHMTPTAYLMARRIQEAQHMLATSDAQISDVALAVGFCDQSHFTRRFRLVIGQTPAAFRRTLKGGR